MVEILYIRDFQIVVRVPLHELPLWGMQEHEYIYIYILCVCMYVLYMCILDIGWGVEGGYWAKKVWEPFCSTHAFVVFTAEKKKKTQNSWNRCYLHMRTTL